jgi:hypothetical protein
MPTDGSFDQPGDHPSQKSRILAVIEKSTGPSPWYWATFPNVVSHARQRFVWAYHGDSGDLAYLVTLSLEQEPNTPRLALNTFCVPFLISPNLLGIWCPEPGGLRVMCFDPDQLAAFPIEEIVGWFKQSNDRVYSRTAPVAEFEVGRRFPEGTHRLEIPEVFHTVDELIAVGSYPARTREDSACAVYVVYPQAGLVEVVPQKWFTASQYDVGRQWISRVTRSNDHRFIGEAVRVGKFQLTPDGQQIDQWIEKA